MPAWCAGDGALARADGLRREVRVRGLAVNNRVAQAGGPGSALRGQSRRHRLRRNRTRRLAADAAAARATDRIDLRLQLLPDGPRKLGQWAGVTLHHAGGHAMARLALLDGALEAGGLAPGASGFVQAVCDRPIFACCGDRIVIRDAAGSETLGGGRVLDPFPPARHRRRPERLAVLAVLEDPDRATRLAPWSSAPLRAGCKELALAHNPPGRGLTDLPPAARHVGRRQVAASSRRPPGLRWVTPLARLCASRAVADEPGVERERLADVCRN